MVFLGLTFGNTPVKLAVELNYYVERPDAFGPKWMLGLNITPVVPNFVEAWFKGPQELSRQDH